MEIRPKKVSAEKRMQVREMLKFYRRQNGSSLVVNPDLAIRLRENKINPELYAIRMTAKVT
jgi:hypothetical protein